MSKTAEHSSNPSVWFAFVSLQNNFPSRSNCWKCSVKDISSESSTFCSAVNRQFFWTALGCRRSRLRSRKRMKEAQLHCCKRVQMSHLRSTPAAWQPSSTWLATHMSWITWTHQNTHGCGSTLYRRPPFFFVCSFCQEGNFGYLLLTDRQKPGRLETTEKPYQSYQPGFSFCCLIPEDWNWQRRRFSHVEPPKHRLLPGGARSERRTSLHGGPWQKKSSSEQSRSPGDEFGGFRRTWWTFRDVLQWFYKGLDMF